MGEVLKFNEEQQRIAKHKLEILKFLYFVRSNAWESARVPSEKEVERYFSNSDTKELSKIVDLLAKFYDILSAFPFSNNELKKIETAIAHFFWIHRKQRRIFEELPYAAHLTRVATKALEYLIFLMKHKELSSDDVIDIVIASFGHDSVEDHAEDIAFLSLDSIEQKERMEKDSFAVRSAALSYVENKFGTSVRHLLNVLSKPFCENPDDKLENYQDWIRCIWQDGDYKTTILKLSDIMDNAESNIKEAAGQILSSVYGGQKLGLSFSVEFESRIRKSLEKYLVALKALYEHMNSDEFKDEVLSIPEIKSKIKEDLKRVIKDAEDIIREFNKKHVGL